MDNMGRPRELAVWEVEALDLGLDPQIVRRKVTQLRARKAKLFGVTIAYMEAVFGWTLDDMGTSLIHAIKHGRCRGPRCNRVSFRQLPLELITCDILNPVDLPLFCVNVGWACSQDNKGDGKRSLAWRMERLVKHRAEQMALSVPLTLEQLSLFSEDG